MHFTEVITKNYKILEGVFFVKVPAPTRVFYFTSPLDKVFHVFHCGTLFFIMSGLVE